MDGWITIGTKLDTLDFEKDMNNLVKKNDDKNIDLKIDIDEKTTEEKIQRIYEVVEESINKAGNELSKIDFKNIDNLQEYINNFDIDNLGIENNIKEIDVLIGGVITDLERMVEAYNELQKAPIKFDDTNQELEELKQKILETVNSLEKLTGQKITIKGINDAEKEIKKINSSLTNVLKKMAKWTLTIFGIRSAYGLVKSMINTISQYNKQMATDLEYMRYAIASSLQKPIEAIIRAIVTLLKYINYIANEWFGINLFASAKDFEKMNKSSAGIAKNVKEINKQTTNWDEMTILQDTSSTSSNVGNVGDITAPSFDLSNWNDVKIPSWVEWIAKNKDKVIKGLAGIAAGLLAVKMGATGIQGLGIGVMLIGILTTIQSLMEYLKDPSWENFGKIIQGIGIAVLGLGLTIASVPLIVIGAAVLIVGTIIKYWNQIKEFLQGGIDWLEGKSDWVKENFGAVGQFIYDTFVDSLQKILDGFDSTFTGIKEIFDGIIQFIKGAFTSDWKKAFEGLGKIAQGVVDVIVGSFKTNFGGIMTVAKNMINFVIDGVNKLISGINNVQFDVPDWVPGIGGKTLSPNIPKIPRLAKGGIISQPGRGIPVGYGQAIGGENGKEGVLPLTDAQAMSELGRIIGENVVINLTNILKLDNRQLAREQKRINSQSDFAYNR